MFFSFSFWVLVMFLNDFNNIVPQFLRYSFLSQLQEWTKLYTLAISEFGFKLDMLHCNTPTCLFIYLFFLQ